MICGAALAGCGSTDAVSHSADASRGSTAGGAAHVPAKTGAGATGAAAGEARIPNVCSLLTVQQIDAALGSGYSPGQVGRPQPGYLSLSSVHVAVLGPKVTLKAAALCDWENPTKTESGLHPQFGYGVDSLSEPVPAAFFFQRHSEAQRVSGLGQWAGYEPIGITLTVGDGDEVLTLDTSDPNVNHPPALKAPLTHLARVIVSEFK